MDAPADKGFALLSRVVEISNSNILIENRLKYICDFLARETGVDRVCVYRRDARSDDLVPWVSSGVEIEECAHFDFRIRLGEGVAGKAAQKRAPVFLADVAAAPPALPVAGEIRDFRSILSVPIMDDVYLYGAMNLSSRAPAGFAEERVALLKVIATEVAGAIRNSKLYKDARKRVSELITLNEISRAITSTFQVRDIVGYVAKTTSRLLQSDGCTIRLVGEGGGVLKVMIDEGYARPALKGELRGTGKLLARQILRERRPLLINGPEDSSMFVPLSRHGVTSFLGLPILSKGKALGVINYYSCSPAVVFDVEVLQLMQTVSSQLANMIENAAMFREAQQLASQNQARARRFATLYNVARALMSTVKTERLLQITLNALTSPSGLNFSRAILFLLSEDGTRLTARMGRGPEDRKGRRRAAPSSARKDAAPSGGPAGFSADMMRNLERVSLPVNDTCLIARAVREKKAIRTEAGCQPGRKGGGDQFCGHHPASFATVPLLVKGQARGAIYVDNLYRNREITQEDIQVLTMFASEACLAMENASLYESLEGALDTIRLTQDRLVQSEKLAALGEMAARIAHEVKNPLTVIGGFAARMARREEAGARDAATTARYADIILKEVKRLERVVQQTLYFSREVAPALQPVDINAEIREVLAMFSEELEEAGIGKVTELGAESPVIAVDPDQIRQVLWNLVANAVQAMGRGGTITVATRSARGDEGDGVVVRVGDTGGGIPHDVVHNIFNPFFTTKPRGTGLGLPIVHAIVRKHGGTIHLDNREGEGVTFSVFLPRVPKEPGAGGRILEQMRKGGGDGSLFREHTR
jgi:two-component system, NtrC family, sensor histidine kinase HydH